MATYNPDIWQDQMRAAQNGDAGAYKALLTGLRPWLCAYFSRRLKGADTDDLVQMTLMAIHVKRETYDPKAPLMPWLCAVARHKLIDHVRKTKRHIHIELDEDLADESMEPNLAARDVAELLKYLPKDQAEVLRLHKLKELSVEEVSHLTGLSGGNIKVLVHRGLKKLQSLVKGGQDG